jgi:hypothetical protein
VVNGGIRDDFGRAILIDPLNDASSANETCLGLW